MKKILSAVVVGLFALMLFSCSSLTIKTDYDHENDFSGYKSYKWYAGNPIPNDALTQNPLIKKRAVIAIDKALQAKGFVLSTDENYEFIVVTHAVTKDRMQVESYGGAYGGYGYRPWWGPYGGTTDVSYYEEGTLVIDIVDRASEELVWRGMGTKTVQDYGDQAKAQEAMNRAVEQVMFAFPPQK